MPWEITPALVSAIVSGLVSGFIASAISIAVFYFKELANVRERVAYLEAKIEPLWAGITRMVSNRIAGASPPSKERTRELLKKFEAGTLGYEEARELKPVLERELEKAREKKDDSLVVNLTILLATLEIKIEMSAPKP